MSQHHNKAKKAISELENLRESKEAAEVVKAELLEQNQILNLHNDEAQIDEPATIAPIDYVNEAQDAQTITQNSAKAFESAEKAVPNATLAEQIFTMNMQLLNSAVDFWSSVYGINDKKNSNKP